MMYPQILRFISYVFLFIEAKRKCHSYRRDQPRASFFICAKA